MLTLEFGLAQIRASLAWSEEALKALQQIESECRPGVEKKPRGPAKKQARH